MSNRRDIQFLYNPHNKATLLDCSFTVDSTNGLGITGLNQSGRIATVFMHTSTTPGTAPNGQVNPNPASGIIVVTLQDNYNRFLAGFSELIAPLSGTPISISGSSVLTIGNPYVITSLGTSTQANWHSMGVPSYITAAVGVSFIASATGSGTGTGTVQAPKSSGSGIDHVEVIGRPALMNSGGNSILGAGVGMQILLGCYAGSGTNSAPTLTMDSYTPAGVITNGTPDTFAGTPAVLTGAVSAPTFTGSKALKAPADGTVINLGFYLNNSAQGV